MTQTQDHGANAVIVGTQAVNDYLQPFEVVREVVDRIIKHILSHPAADNLEFATAAFVTAIEKLITKYPNAGYERWLPQPGRNVGNLYTEAVDALENGLNS